MTLNNIKKSKVGNLAGSPRYRSSISRMKMLLIKTLSPQISSSYIWSITLLRRRFIRVGEWSVLSSRCRTSILMCSNTSSTSSLPSLRALLSCTQKTSSSSCSTLLSSLTLRVSCCSSRTWMRLRMPRWLDQLLRDNWTKGSTRMWTTMMSWSISRASLEKSPWPISRF